MKDRFDIAADLRMIARLLEIRGENSFKTQAYERGARALENLERDFDDLVKTGRLKEIAGIGNVLGAIIEEIYRTGECWLLQQLRDGLPPGVIELSAVPGLNLKKLIALHDGEASVGYRQPPPSQRWLFAAQSCTGRSGANSGASAYRS